MDTRRPDVSIVTSGHDVADARIHRLAAALADAGSTVELIGLGDAAAAPPGIGVRTTPRGGPARRVVTAVRAAATARGRVLVALDPDSLLASLVVARLRRRRVVADVHEDYEALLRDRMWARGAKGVVAGWLARLATASAKRADLVVVADEHVPPRDAPRRIVLRNLPYLTMLPAPTEPDPSPRAIYIGDVRESRGLWDMIEAVESAPDWTLDLVGPVAAGDADRLDEYAVAGAARHRVRVHGRKPPRDSWRLASGAWCGFVLLQDTPAFRAAMPSKLYEYLACGLPVIVTDLPRQRDFVDEWRAGEVVIAGERTGADAAAVLRRWTAQGDELAARRASAAAFRDQAAQWTEAYAVVARAVAALASPRLPGATAS